MGRSPHGERGLKLQKFMIIVGKWSGRSPHGERGLKLLSICRFSISAFVAPHTGSVDWNNLGSKKLFELVVAPHTGSVD